MSASGRLVIMGSGETAPTMIKTHRMILDSIPDGSAVLLDTPYGFQENADDITARAQHYFRTSVSREVTAAGWRSAELEGLAREQALTAIRSAQWVFAGPGSPTYALRAWRDTPLPGLLRETVAAGGTVVFASAAALTLGSHTVPVHEIYKAGLAPFWERGLNILADLTGLPAVAIPHYDNAEGGHHDTRFCYLGERRLSALEGELPAEAFVLGVDEHTAVIVDVGAGSASVVGNGNLTIRRRGVSVVHPAGTVLGLAELGAVTDASAGSLHNLPGAAAESGGSGANGPSDSPSLRSAADQCQARFTSALAYPDTDATVAVALALEEAIHDWAGDTLSSDDADHARGLLRSMVVELGRLARKGAAADPADAIRPYVNLLITLRDRARDGKDFASSDEIRDALATAGVEVQDTPAGPQWSLTPPA